MVVPWDMGVMVVPWYLGILEKFDPKDWAIGWLYGGYDDMSKLGGRLI